jgi:signal transduction histidine kinase
VPHRAVGRAGRSVHGRRTVRGAVSADAERTDGPPATTVAAVSRAAIVLLSMGEPFRRAGLAIRPAQNRRDEGGPESSPREGTGHPPREGRRDVLLAAVITVLSFVPGLADKGTALGWPVPHRSLDLLATVLVLGHSLPLALRTRSPVTCLTLVSAAFAAYQCLGYRPTFATCALYIALYSAGSYQLRRRRLTVAVWSAGFAALALGLTILGSPNRPHEYAEFFATPAACWLAGTLVRRRLGEQAGEQQRRLEAARREERDSLARDLHDVVTHHVTAMVMQADAGRYVPPDDRAGIEKGLSAIGDTGRRALADLRHLLGVLSPGHDAPRAPATGSLHELVDRVRSAGQPVELIESGHPRRVGDVAELTAYRVVQEALTNALKYAPGRITTVRVSSAIPGQLAVEVTTEGPASGAPDRAPSGGRGLTGLRQRVSQTGGQMDSYLREDGGFVVSATLADPGGPE